MSMSSAPGFSFEASLPPPPSITSRTMPPLGSMVTTTSQASPSSTIEDAAFTPISPACPRAASTFAS